MDTQVLTDQQKFILISFVQALDAVERTCQELWLIVMDGESQGKFMLSSHLHDERINFGHNRKNTASLSLHAHICWKLETDHVNKSGSLSFLTPTAKLPLWQKGRINIVTPISYDWPMVCYMQIDYKSRLVR